jgi:hypothetical protein
MLTANLGRRNAQCGQARLAMPSATAHADAVAQGGLGVASNSLPAAVPGQAAPSPKACAFQFGNFLPVLPRINSSI